MCDARGEGVDVFISTDGKLKKVSLSKRKSIKDFDTNDINDFVLLSQRILSVNGARQLMLLIFYICSVTQIMQRGGAANSWSIYPLTTHKWRLKWRTQRSSVVIEAAIRSHHL